MRAWLPTFAKPPSELALGMVAWEKDRMYWRPGIAGAAELPYRQTSQAFHQAAHTVSEAVLPSEHHSQWCSLLCVNICQS